MCSRRKYIASLKKNLKAIKRDFFYFFLLFIVLLFYLIYRVLMANLKCNKRRYKGVLYKFKYNALESV